MATSLDVKEDNGMKSSLLEKKNQDKNSYHGENHDGADQVCRKCRGDLRNFSSYYRGPEVLFRATSIIMVPDNSDVTKGVLKKIIIACSLAFIFFLAEVAGGVISGSLAILTDAAHMLSDVAGFLISIYSVYKGT
jgi:hypothetical protein